MVKISQLISAKIKKKVNEELVKVKFNLTLDKIIQYIIIGSFFLSFVVMLFFKTQIQLAPNFSWALTGYFFLSYLISLIACVLFVYGLVIYKEAKRKKEIEFVLADYLQVVAANLNAGMPIDQALWYAVRERFGVLAEEVELLARKVMGGIDLEQALMDFAKSYDSDLLHKSMILLIEGLKSGGELAPLVNKISWNIKETQLLEREISAETATYTIFIIFAALFAAPALYSLSHRIILIMAQVTSKIDYESITGVTTPLPLVLGQQPIVAQDFKVFAILSLIITSTVSAIIISKIKHGTAKESVKFIPFFILVSVVLFLILIVVLGQLFADLAL
ncbi:MAG: type II secretion system F family protein [Nanoarchaeota archaeon]